MSLLGGKSSSNILIKKRKRAGKKQTPLKSGNNTTKTTEFLHQGISANQSHALNWFPEKTFTLSITTSAVKDLFRFMKSKSLMKSVWFKREKDHILMTGNHLKCWKIIHNFSYISEFQKILLSCDKINVPEGSLVSLKLWVRYKNFKVHIKT